MSLLNTQGNTQVTYLTILADGKLHENVSQNTPGAIRRDFTTSDDLAGVKYELLHDGVEGVITGVYITPGKYGENLHILLSADDGRRYNISAGTASPFGEDLMHKLPSVRWVTPRVQSEPIGIAPYSFTDKKTLKAKRGVTLTQMVNGEVTKLQNFFRGADAKVTHGIPTTPEDAYKTFTKDQWKLHFLQVRVFLTDYIQKNIASAREEREQFTPSTPFTGKLAGEQGTLFEVTYDDVM